MRLYQKLGAAVGALTLAVALGACDGSDGDTTAQQANAKARTNVQNKNRSFAAPEIKNNQEYQNYIKAQKLYDSNTTIIWCSTTWGNASAPLVTVPVVGKLTSSSVSLFPSQQVKQYYNNDGTYNPELPSVDGMYHGTPPQYRYGFTPGGQYVDFFNMPTFCTTALTKFQRSASKVTVSLDADALTAQKQAEAALAKCNANTSTAKPDLSASCPAASDALQAALGGAGQ